MSRICQVTGKSPLTGNRISHSNIKTKRRFLPNVRDQRFFVPAENRWIRLRVSAAGVRNIDKLGIEVIVAELRARGQKV